MEQPTYWIYSTTISTIALVISACSLLLGWINRSEMRRTVLLNRKTEVLEKIYTRRAKIGHLILIYAEMLLLFSEKKSLREKYLSEHIRVRNNLAVLQGESQSALELADQLRSLNPSNIEAWEDMLATAKGFLSDVTEELEKEKKALEWLKDASKEEAKINIDT
jgi:hypothetical protein